MKAQIESDQSALEVVVKLIYEKAISSPRFAPLYADLCVCIILTLFIAPLSLLKFIFF